MVNTNANLNDKWQYTKKNEYGRKQKWKVIDNSVKIKDIWCKKIRGISNKKENDNISKTETLIAY